MGLLEDKISFFTLLSMSVSAIIKPSELAIAFFARAEKLGVFKSFVNSPSRPSKANFLIRLEERGSSNGVLKIEETTLVLAKIGSSV